MTEGFGLVVNGRARAVRRRYLGPAPFWASHLPSHAVSVTHTLEELDDAIARFCARNVRVVAGLGGDGSLHHLVDAIVRHYDHASLPVVLVLAGGTMNGLARAIGSGGAPDDVLATSLALLESGQLPVRKLPLLRVEDASHDVLHGFSFATGLVFRAFETYYRRPEPGIRDAVVASLLPLRTALFGGSFYDPVRLEINADDSGPWMSGAPHTLLASVVDRPLLWFRPFGEVADHTDLINVAATMMRPREIAPRLWSIFRGRCRHPGVRIGRCSSLTVRGDCGYLIDGDLYRPESTNVTISRGPRMNFLQPTA